MVLKKKEIIAASLVVLIGVAGYLNWSYQDTIKVRDGESYIETGKKLGEAQYVNAVDDQEEKTEEDGEKTEETNAENTENNEENVTETANSENYFEQARLNKENSRSKSLEILNQTAENDSFDSEIRQKAGDKILAVANNVQKESEIESIAQSKGYSEICVYVDDSEANVMVRKNGFNDEDAVKLTAIVKIVEVK